jgi:hypothetical protein
MGIPIILVLHFIQHSTIKSTVAVKDSVEGIMILPIWLALSLKCTLLLDHVTSVQVPDGVQMLVTGFNYSFISGTMV